MSGATKGVLWMLLTGFCFVGVTVTVKLLGSAVPAPQAAFLRYVIGIVLVLPSLVPILRAHISGEEMVRFGLRGLFQGLGVIAWFGAMTRLPVAEVTAMGYLTPVAVSIGAILLYGERFSAARLAALVLAFVGVLIVVRPGFREVSLGHLFMIGTMCCFSVSYLMAKRMSAERSASVVVGMLSVTTTLALAPFALAVWAPVSASQIGLLAIVAVLATAGHWCMTRAFAVAPLGITQPVVFLQLIWATAAGALLFAEPVDGWIVLGGAVIVGAVSWLALRDARRVSASAASRDRALPHPPDPAV